MIVGSSCRLDNEAVSFWNFQSDGPFWILVVSPFVEHDPAVTPEGLENLCNENGTWTNGPTGFCSSKSRVNCLGRKGQGLPEIIGQLGICTIHSRSSLWNYERSSWRDVSFILDCVAKFPLMRIANYDFVGGDGIGGGGA